MTPSKSEDSDEKCKIPDSLQVTCLDYEQTIEYVKLLTDIRFRLLVFTPVVSGITIALSEYILKNNGIAFIIGVLGFVATFGIIIYDQRNSQIYNRASKRAARLEKKLNFHNFSIIGFSWYKIQETDNAKIDKERLIEFLTENFGIDWVKTANVKKMADNNIIKVSTDKNFLRLTLNDKKTRVILHIDDGRTYKLIAERENEELNIYDPKKGGLFSEKPSRSRKLFGHITAWHDRGLALVYSASLSGWAFLIIYSLINIFSNYGPFLNHHLFYSNNMYHSFTSTTMNQISNYIYSILFAIALGIMIFFDLERLDQDPHKSDREIESQPISDRNDDES